MTTQQTPYTKPIPGTDRDSETFWEAAHRHELMAQRCNKCGRFRHPPRAHCSQCLSTDYTWTKLSGKGKVYTYIIVSHTVIPAFAQDVPYNVTQVALDEDTDRSAVFTTNLVNVKNEDIKAGMPVEVVFDDVTPDVTLPKFRPIRR